MSPFGLNLEKFLIPLVEINRATENFSLETQIGGGGYGKVFRGQLSERWHNRIAAFKRRNLESDQGKVEFLNELELLSRFDHENIIPFIGYCDEGDEMIIVTEYAINGSLDDYLEDPNLRPRLTWAQRLEICLGVAKGLQYLHSGFGEGGKIIQREPKSGNILLDENMVPKICDFGFSILIPRNQPYVNDARVAGTMYYLDPVYNESGLVTAKTDTYPFGMVLFEMVSGMLAYHERSFEDSKPLHLMQWVRRYYDVGFDKIIDPFIRDQIDRLSLDMVKEIAYKCISFNIKDRPTFDVIVKTIDRALDIHKNGAASIIPVQNIQHKNPHFFKISLEEIKRATNNFSPESLIGNGIFVKVYTCQLSEHWQNRYAAIKRRDPQSDQGEVEFLNELELMSSFHHENIIPFIGYCDEDDEMIIVTEYAVNGSLDGYLPDVDKRRLLTWARRLKICSGVAAGLKYLHSGLGERGKVIQRDVKSGNILLDKNMNAKICDFGLSILISRNQPHIYLPFLVGTEYCMDPVYRESGYLKPEADVYAFGVLMFELLCGMSADTARILEDVKPQNLMNLVRSYSNDEPEILVDPLIKNEVDSRSLRLFTDLAYECVSFDIRERPWVNKITKRIEAIIDLQNRTTTTIQSHQKQKLEDFLIPLEEIKIATKDFSPKTLVDDGGFGDVHKGELSERWNKGATVAIKRLIKPSDEGGNKDFLNELNLIFRFQHENIIPFIGYCDQGNEMIIVTKYASNGSLGSYLKDPEKRGCLTWTQRLKICLGAARGLNHLHFGHGKGNTVIHRDIKSANILLDDKLEARICDFGLSKLDQFTSESQTGIYTKHAGTKFYMDPIYQETGKLRTNSDVYSFGVVMFEVLSGMMAWVRNKIGDGKPQVLISLVRSYYVAGALEMLIDSPIRDKPYPYDIDALSFKVFQDTAYECINMNYKERPTMDIIVDRIEEALRYQDSRDGKEVVKGPAVKRKSTSAGASTSRKKTPKPKYGDIGA